MEKIKVANKRRPHYWVYDREGALIGIASKNTEKNLSENEWLRGVSCFVINENDEILIEKRVNKGLTPGKLDLCSGHIDGNELDTQAMVRELEEELGIGIERASNVKKITDEEYALSFESSGKTKNFFITFFGLRVKKEDVKFSKEEVQDIAWLDKEKAFKLIRIGETKFPKDFDYEQIFKNLTEIFCSKEEKNDGERE